MKDLEPAIRKAFLSYQYEETKQGRKLQDQEAYQLLKEEGIPDDGGDLGELSNYNLPAFETWVRQLRTARQALGEQKYTPRRGRQHGRSIARGDQVEFQGGDDEHE